MVFCKDSYKIFFIGFFYLIILQFGSILELVPESNYGNNGFYDDFNYLDINRIEDSLGETSDGLNLGYWVIAKFAYLFYPFNAIVLKFINLIFLCFATCCCSKILKIEIYKSSNRVLRNGLYTLLIVPFIPSLWVVSKEPLILFLISYAFYRLNIYLSKRTMDDLLVVFIAAMFVLSSRYIFGLLLLSMVFFAMYKNSKVLLFICSFALILLSIIYNESITGYLSYAILDRAIDMYNEGINYGLFSDVDSISRMYSGKIYYSFFQYITQPIPQKTLGLYTTYVFIPPTIIIGMAFVCIYYKSISEYLRYILYFSIFSSVVIIGLNFGSNFRYKFVPAWFIVLIVTYLIGIGRIKFRIVASCYAITIFVCATIYFLRR